MGKTAKNKNRRPVFDSIRKPTAPAGKRFGTEKPPERAHPAARKVKHKNKPVNKDPNGDL
jgi:hypothetical protein